MNKFFTKFAANAAVKRAGIIAVGCIGFGLLTASPAKGQFDTAAIMAFLTTMNTTMQSAMAVPLQIMQQVNSDMSTFTQTASILCNRSKRPRALTHRVCPRLRTCRA